MNKADFFKDICIGDITICTEDQLLKYCSKAIDDEYVYKKEVSTKPVYVQTEEPVETEGSSFLSSLADDGSWSIEMPQDDSTDNKAFSCSIAGKPSVPEGCRLKLVVTNSQYKVEEGLESDNIIAVFPGRFIKTDTVTWTVKGKKEIGDEKPLKFCLYITDKQGNATLLNPKGDEDSSWKFKFAAFTVERKADVKEIHLVLGRNDFNEKFCEPDLSKHMFFVYIRGLGFPGPCTPCRLDEMTTVGVTFDYGLVYNAALGYMKELQDTCSIPQGFIDFILNFNALKIAVETDHYMPAIEHYKRLVGGDYSMAAQGGSYKTKPCGCHG